MQARSSLSTVPPLALQSPTGSMGLSQVGRLSASFFGWPVMAVLLMVLIGFLGVYGFESFTPGHPLSW